MGKNIQISLIFVILGLLALASLAAQVAAPFSQDQAPTPESGLTLEPQPELEPDLASQSGSTDGIALLGILLLLIILVPVFGMRQEW